jgi:hypothetical protein
MEAQSDGKRESYTKTYGFMNYWITMPVSAKLDTGTNDSFLMVWDIFHMHDVLGVSHTPAFI